MPSPASPGTNNFRCNACGRYFNTQAELRGHEPDCRAAKQTTEEGRRELEEQDTRPHSKNDGDSTEHPFPHGRAQG
jgi:tRNA(Ile2) C34 agmatinyltransferase TiaS